MPQLFKLELQLLVGFGKLACSFRNPPVEFAFKLLWISWFRAHTRPPLQMIFLTGT
jgi:hypothetical protein